jgi:ribosome biogenesis GTPase / thiamine phosphate phosphatase
MHTELNMLLYRPRFAQEALLYPSLCPGRVVLQQKDYYSVVTGTGEVLAQVSGKLRYESASPLGFPAVGDFVMLEGGVIRHVLSRSSVLTRKAAGRTQEQQVIAANVDVVLICMALDADFNLRRLERYLTLVWDSGATPVVVLTKADLCEDAPARIVQAQSAAIGAEVVTASSLASEGAAALLPYIRGNTVALVGSSGVGKSTLINCLAGDTLMDTGGLRADGKGRHTTTHRELFPLCGGAVIDTPGMRELGMDGGDFERSFSDIEALAAQCRFGDCAHKTEPGCAVLEAVRRGEISEQRLDSFHKLRKEAGYDGLTSREIEAAKRRVMFPHGGEAYIVKK